MIVVGIDPGKKGGLAIIELETLKATVMDLCVEALIALCENRGDEIVRVFIEKQQAFPNQGVVSTANLMRHYGELLGVLRAFRIPFEQVHPRRWQNSILGRGHGRKLRKRQAIEKARELFPHAKVGRKDGRADALLIAEWGRRQIAMAHQRK